MSEPSTVPEHADREPPLPAPPTTPSGDLAGPHSSWPGVIGTLICVFAGLGILQRLFGGVFAAIMPWLPLPPEAQLPRNLWIFTLVVSVVSLPISFIHLMAGIQTLRRKPSARRWVIIFFAYVVLMLPPGMVLQYMSFQHQMNISSQQGSVPAGMGVASVVFGLLFALAWPTFLLIWYSRGSIRDEMAGWGTA